MNQEEEPKRGDFAKKKGEIVLRKHEYDGIQEYDQKLPNWWLFTFYGAIVWFVVYWLLYYQFPVFKTDDQSLTSSMEKVFEVQAAELEKTLSEIDDPTLVHLWATDAKKVAAGQEAYMANCVPCHGNDLSATLLTGDQVIELPGLPLNDGKWKFGSKPLEIFRMI